MTTLWQWETAFIELIARIRHNGIKIDREFCKPKIAQGEEILSNIRGDLGWNPGSSQQIGHFLIEEMGYPVVKRSAKTQKPSFDKFALEEYELMLEADGSDLATKILTYRGWQKTVSSNYKAYLKLADRYDILHPNYKVHGTRTCRTSCEDPNLQQIPRYSEKPWNGDVKRAFISRDGKTVLVEFDYAQLELRLGAAAAKETRLIQAFWDGVDVFQVMADDLGWERQDCKTLTYATGYGAGVDKIALIFKIPKFEAKKRIGAFFDEYPQLKIKPKEAERVAKHRGYIQYWTGRRRHLPTDTHKAWNAYVQGGAFEIIKRSGLRLAEHISWPMVLTVHDSYVVEFPIAEYTDENCNKVKRILEAVPEASSMGVPFKVDYKVWGSK